MFLMGNAYQHLFVSDIWINAQNNYKNTGTCIHEDIQSNSSWFQMSNTKPLMYVRYIIQITTYMIFTNIIMISIMEWASMYYIVKSQEGRSIGEIMFDHQQENMESDVSSRDNSVDSRFKH